MKVHNFFLRIVTLLCLLFATPVSAQHTLGIGMFNDVNENHPFTFDMYRFFQQNPIKVAGDSNLQVTMVDRPGLTDYYITGSIFYFYTDTATGSSQSGKNISSRTYSKKSYSIYNHSYSLYCDNLCYLYEWKLYKGKNLVQTYRNILRRGTYDQQDGCYICYGIGAFNSGRYLRNTVAKPLFGVRTWPVNYLESATYRELYNTVKGNYPNEKLKPVAVVKEIMGLKWEKKDKEYNPAQYINTMYDSTDNELLYNAGLNYYEDNEKIPATITNADRSSATGFFPGSLINYVPQDAITTDSVLLREHYTGTPEFNVATADDVLDVLHLFYENSGMGNAWDDDHGTKYAIPDYIYKYESKREIDVMGNIPNPDRPFKYEYLWKNDYEDNFYRSYIGLILGKHKQPGNCMTLLYIAKKYADEGNINASNFVYQQVLLESNTVLSSGPVAKAFRLYAYKGMQANADKQNHKHYSDLLALIQNTVSGYLTSQTAGNDETNYRKDILTITNFVNDMVQKQHEINKAKFWNSMASIAGAAVANAGTITDAASGNTDANTAINNTANTMGENLNSSGNENAKMTANYKRSLAKANLNSKVAAVNKEGDLSTDNSLAAQEILSFAQIDTTGAYVIPALEKYAADKPVLQGLISDYKTALSSNADYSSSLTAIYKHLKKIERTVAKYELVGEPMPSDVQF